MRMCRKCNALAGAFLLLFGVLYLLKDLGRLTFFWPNWWTLLFIMVGLGRLLAGCCKDCREMNGWCTDECCKGPCTCGGKDCPECGPKVAEVKVAAPAAAPAAKPKKK